MATKYHTVAKGETLSKIASKYGTTAAAIQKENKALIKDVNKIKVGWRLKISSFATPSKGYEEIGKQFQKALNDIRNVPSVKKLIEMVGE